MKNPVDIKGATIESVRTMHSWNDAFKWIEAIDSKGRVYRIDVTKVIAPLLKKSVLAVIKSRKYWHIVAVKRR